MTFVRTFGTEPAQAGSNAQQETGSLEGDGIFNRGGRIRL